MKKSVITGLFLTLFSTTLFASDACIYGTATWASGSKIDGSSRISTSWNSKEAYPKNGSYRLCLGSNPQSKITIYLNGSTYAKVYVDGDTKVNIIRK